MKEKNAILADGRGGPHFPFLPALGGAVRVRPPLASERIAESAYLRKIVAKMMENARNGDPAALKFIADNLHAPSANIGKAKR